MIFYLTFLQNVYNKKNLIENEDNGEHFLIALTAGLYCFDNNNSDILNHIRTCHPDKYKLNR